MLFQADLRKYTQGHKAVIVPYNKAFDTLKKFRKKTKNKYVYDNEKEAPLDPCTKITIYIVLLFQADLRKYTQGHKAVIVPYNKAFDTLKKFRKKTKNKYVYDNEKEAQVIVNEKNCTKVVCFSRLLKCFRSLYDKQCGSRSTAPIGAV